jgi:phosphoglycolate phosphatase
MNPSARPSRRIDPNRPTLVFDLDGTLADTASDLIRTLNILLAREDVAPVPLEKARDVVGAGARAMLERGLALGGRSVSSDRLGELFRDFLSHYADNIAVETKLFTGVEDALVHFSSRGHRLAVCTNKMEEHSLRLLAALGVADQFDAICGRDTFAWAKPDARHLTLTVEKAGGDPRRAIMVGDSRTDIDTARAAGLPVIAVDFGYTDVPVAQLGPDRIVSRYRDLAEAVDALEATFA